MPETLLSPSRVLLFGRKMGDLQIRTGSAKTVQFASTKPITTNGLVEVDKESTAAGEKVLVKNQANAAQNGIYTVVDGGPWTNPAGDQPQEGEVIFVEKGRKNGGSSWVKENGKFKRVGPGRNKGKNRQVEDQLPGACFARIYGFSYEGMYYDLPRPALFMVHGDGEEAVLPSLAGGGHLDANLARAPREPSVSGVAAADFQLADDIRVWSYDKADYTIRMDVETGMFEQVLLDMAFGEGPIVSGARVSGARVSGARVSGARVSGARVSGARLGGGRGDASD